MSDSFFAAEACLLLHYTYTFVYMPLHGATLAACGIALPVPHVTRRAGPYAAFAPQQVPELPGYVLRANLASSTTTLTG